MVYLQTSPQNGYAVQGWSPEGALTGLRPSKNTPEYGEPVGSHGSE
jgi:hypothetical protein